MTNNQILYYNTKNNQISFDEINWIKADNYKKIEEWRFFDFLFNSDNYLIYHWKDYAPKCFKETKDNNIYQGEFEETIDIPYIYCKEWQILAGENKEKVKARLKELRKTEGENDE